MLPWSSYFEGYEVYHEKQSFFNVVIKTVLFLRWFEALAFYLKQPEIQPIFLTKTHPNPHPKLYAKMATLLSLG